ncbi:MAG: protein kinase domain-containing protein, partial [Aureliella sp.]
MAIDEARDDDEALQGDESLHRDEAFHGDEALERSAAYDELLRSGLSAAACSTDDFDAETGSEGADVPAAGIIRLLHEVFRGPRGGQVPDREPPLERVGRFIIHRMLGRGAFGRVYLAHDPILRRQVALKVFHQHLLADESTRRHVLREREIMARLQHPNIVPVWEAGEENELLYISSEYCAGPTLDEWLADRKQRTELLGQGAVSS